MADLPYTVVAVRRGRGGQDHSIDAFEIDAFDEERTDVRDWVPADLVDEWIGPEREQERVMQSDVLPGGTEVVLRFSTLAVRGTLQDDTGAPLDDFVLIARPGGFERRDALVDYVARYARAGIADRFRDGAGRFSFQGFAPGRWTLLAWANGHGLSKPRELTLPTSDDVALVLPRGGRIEGIVVDPSGQGVPAEIVIQEVAPFGSFDNADWPDEGVPTAADGTFGLDVVHGTAYLYARSDALAPSQITGLPVEPGSLRADVRLALEPAGRIEVELLDAQGEPLKGHTIDLDKGFLLRSEHRRTDAEGRAVFEKLASGEYSVEAETGIRSKVELSPGGTQRVVLREDQPPARETPLQPVRVSGRAMDGTKPIADRLLWFRHEGGREKTTHLDSEGRFSVSLPAPGEYEVFIPEEGSLARSLRVDVPAVATFEWNISLGEGGIAGFVRGPGGEPIAGATVHAVSEDGSRHTGGDPARTDATGAYTLAVPAGTYRVLATEQDWDARGLEVPHSLATAERRGIVVEAGETPTRVDFDLGPGATVEGTVRLADGTTPVFAIASIDSDPPVVAPCHGGTFRIAGVPPGSSRVSAFFEGLVTSEPVAIEIAAGATASVELVLVRATEVQFRTLDANGEPVDAQLEVRPTRGLIGGEFSRGALLPDGRYTVVATAAGRTAETTFEIAGEESQVVDLRFE